MGFHPGVMLVFDRSGSTLLGQLTKWTTSAPRTYRMGEVEDMVFRVPLRDETGTVVLTAGVLALLNTDNLVYIEDELTGLPGWGGSISDPSFQNGYVEVKCLGGLGLFQKLETTLITQTGGTSDLAAAALVAAANAKQSAHGDLVVRLVVDGTTQNYGIWQYEGDILQGLQQCVSDLLAEMWIEWVLGPGATSLSCNLHWNSRIAIDKTNILITDGPGGAITTGSQITYSALEPVNRLRLKGLSTNFAQYLDYPVVASVLKDIVPTVEYIDPSSPPNMRRREALTLSVNIGYSVALQTAIAKSIQDTYLGYYKSFLYAHHHVLGKPFLDGFDWSGMDGVIDKSITARYYRTYQRLGFIRGSGIVVTETNGPGTGAVIDQWSLDQIISPVTTAVGVALDYQTLTGHWYADGSNGHLVEVDADGTTTDWGNAAGGGTLAGIATDGGDPSSLYVLVNSGGNSTMKVFDINSMALLSQWTVSGTYNDLAIDVANGLVYLVGVGSNVVIRDLASGTVLSPDPSYAAGLSPKGISVTGGLAYVVDSGGHIRMLFTPGGTLAGTFDTGVAGAAGIFADWRNRRVYIIQGDGRVAVYHAYIAVGTIPAPGSVDGAPGFDAISGGQYVHIVMANDYALSAKNTKRAAGSYTVVHGDNLWNIALRYYGHGSAWPTIYNANRGVIGSNPDLIFPGQVLVIPGNGGHVTAPVPANPAATKYLIVYTKAAWVTTPVPGPIGQPDYLQKVWTPSDQQVVGFLGAAQTDLIDPFVVIQGEEGRVADWKPTEHGYGVYKDEQLYRTAKNAGFSTKAGPGWYPQDWDVPDTAFQPVAPPWPEGLQYALDWLHKHNGSITVQTFRVTNLNNLWDSVQIGALYTVRFTRQGVPGTGLTGTLRVLNFSPDEAKGEMEISGEWFA